MRDARSAIGERIERTEISSERKADMLKRMDDEFFGHIKGVYFPLARFGQYLVVVKDADGKVANVSRAETMAEADTTRRQLVGALPPRASRWARCSRPRTSWPSATAWAVVSWSSCTGCWTSRAWTPSSARSWKTPWASCNLSSLPDLSWAKHGIHRKGTAETARTRRAFAQNVFHGASYLAKLRYGDRLQDELGEMQRRVDAGAADPNFDSVKAQQVVDKRWSSATTQP